MTAPGVRPPAAAAGGGDRVLAVLDAAVAAGAVAGGWYVARGAPRWDRAWLEGTPFRSFAVPGLALTFVHAPLDAAAAWALWRGDRRATRLALASAAVQCGWIAGQFAMIGLRTRVQLVFGPAAALSLRLAIARARRG